jgi:nucleotide-binding universal stress UspA family protein
MRAARQQALEETLEKLEINAIELHVIEGKPAVTVANLANRLDVTVAVLGTSARTGLKKLLLGNTSEAMIGRLKQDILTVRTSR